MATVSPRPLYLHLVPAQPLRPTVSLPRFAKTSDLRRLRCPTAKAFRDQCFDPKSPAIITGAVKTQWSFAKIDAAFGDERLEFISNFTGPQARLNRTRKSKRTVPRTRAGGLPPETEIPNAESTTVSRLLEDMAAGRGQGRYTQMGTDDKKSLGAKFLAASSIAPFYPKPDGAFFWMGETSGSIGMHHDAGCDNLIAQFIGRKAVALVEPKYLAEMSPFSFFGKDNQPTTKYQYDTFRSRATARNLIDQVDKREFPRFYEVEGQVGVLEPGDMLYIPNSWFHCLMNQGPTVSISFRWLAPGYNENRATFVALMNLLLTFLKSLPSAQRVEFQSRLGYELTLGNYLTGELFDGITAPSGFHAWKSFQPLVLDLMARYLRQAMSDEHHDRVSADFWNRNLEALGCKHVTEQRELQKFMRGMINYF
jgi:hypothetical protein